MPNLKKYNHPNLINKKIMSKPKKKKKKKKGMRTKETLNKVIEAQESK